MIYRILTLLLIVLMPLSASAQFVPIQQAKDQVASSERTELDTVLTDISSKGDIARRQVQTILSEAAAKNIGASAAGRRIETIVGNLKTSLNGIINAYAKKNPPANQLRAAYNSAQDTLNSIRRQSGEVLDQVGFDKAADPKALSGKYLDYQNELKAITETGLQEADDRLSDRGTKETVTKDLERIAASTQKKIDINTTSFLASNPDVLPSAVERVKKGVVEAFGKAMATRFATAKERGSDKTLDLSSEELAKVKAAKEEMQGMADRALQTVEALLTQISSSNIPTASNVPGQNPLLEAKYRASQQLKQIRASTTERIQKVNARFQSDKDNTDLAKEVVNKDSKKILATTNDTFGEMSRFFSSGDPSKKKYNKAKNDAQDEAEGCTDFFCNLGRVVSDVGSGVLAATTGVQIHPKTFTSIMGIKDGTGYASSRYSGGNYAGSYAGGQTVPFNPNCYGALPTQQSQAPRFALIEKAQAQQKSGTDAMRESLSKDLQAGSGSAGATTDSVSGSSGSTGTSGTFRDMLKNEFREQTGFTGSVGTSTKTTKSSSGVSLSDGSTWRNIFQNISPWLNNTIQRAANPGASNGYFGSCYGQMSGTGGIPGYGSVYGGGMGGSTMGCIGAIQMFQTCDVGINGGFMNQSNANQQLAAALVLLSQNDTANAAKYQQAVNILQSGPLTFDKIPLLQQALAGTNMNTVFGSYGTSNPISGLVYSVCAQVPTIANNQALISLCQKMLIPSQTPGINPNASGTLSQQPTNLSTATDPDVLKIQSYKQTVDHYNEIVSPTKCASFKKNISDIITESTAMQTRYIATQASSNNRQILSSLAAILNSARSIENTCALQLAGGGTTVLAKTEFDTARETIADYRKAFEKLGKCDELDRKYGTDMATNVANLQAKINSNLTGRSPEQVAQALEELRLLKVSADTFSNSCASVSASSAATAFSRATSLLGSIPTSLLLPGLTSTSAGTSTIEVSRAPAFAQFTYKVSIYNKTRNTSVPPFILTDKTNSYSVYVGETYKVFYKPVINGTEITDVYDEYWVTPTAVGGLCTIQVPLQPVGACSSELKTSTLSK